MRLKNFLARWLFGISLMEFHRAMDELVRYRRLLPGYTQQQRADEKRFLRAWNADANSGDAVQYERATP